jgi:hypothetical protein
LLGKIARQSDDEEIRQVLKEDEHLSWAKEQLARLEFAAIAKE